MNQDLFTGYENVFTGWIMLNRALILCRICQVMESRQRLKPRFTLHPHRVLSTEGHWSNFWRPKIYRSILWTITVNNCDTHTYIHTYLILMHIPYIAWGSSFCLCDQCRPRPACTSLQPNHGLHCLLFSL